MIRKAALFLLLASPALAGGEGGVIADYQQINSACIAYLNGDANAVTKLSQHGFEVSKRGKKLMAIKRGDVSVPMNRRVEVVLTVGKKIPMGAEATCQLDVTRIGKGEAQVMAALSTASVTSLGFAPRGGNGMMMAKYDKGDQTWIVSGSYETSFGMLNQIISKMK